MRTTHPDSDVSTSTSSKRAARTPDVTRPRIRDAKSADVQQIAAIEQLSFEQPWSPEAFAHELSLPFSRTIVSLSQDDTDRTIIGYLCRWLVADECHILSLAVAPSFRRAGIAEFLMSEAISEAKRRGATIITLEVRRSNLAARNLYRKLHFAERRVRKNYYGPGEDAIIMERRLHGVA
jgi:[ribosomal protein S18]-alanine N-acetyltransferase